jgi:hypothetical protein
LFLKPEDLSKMNGYIFDIYKTHYIELENKEEDGTFTTSCDLAEIGSLNKIKEMIHDITFIPVTSN